MRMRSLIVTSVLIGTLGLLLCASLVAAQSDVADPANIQKEQDNTRVEATTPTFDPIVDAQFEARIAETQQDAQARVSELQASLQNASDADVEAIHAQIMTVKKESQISILEIRQEQYQARGDAEMAAKFQRAAEMMRNPAPRQAPDPAIDQARSEQHRTTQEQTKR
jgi:hypothetical protein